MMGSVDRDWEDALHNACFPVTLAEVFVGNPSRRARRYRAVVPVDAASDGEPFAIVTDRYRLIRNEDVIDLGHEAFERLFGSQHRARMAVFNVLLANGRGSFLADFTAPELRCSIPVPRRNNPVAEVETEPSRHTFFLRVVNSYNRTQAVRLEAGICRWICRNGMIFGKQSIQFRDPHHKTKYQLMDEIAEHAERLRTDALPATIGEVYAVALAPDMTVVEGVWQTLRLAIPPVDSKSRSARLWRDRCRALCAVSEDYQDHYGRTVFSVLQAASQWARDQAHTSPIQRHSYERRCGEMLEALTAGGQWPTRATNAREQVQRICDWSRLPMSGR
ncbi:MAG: DUF932 domain-containing protein [Rhodospirillales bacterium]|nr:DUF932 domain-containing protein [Rhodospirillales bacterium]